MITVDRLFSLYREAGFLYPEKMKRLERHLVEIQDNWERLLASHDDLLTVHASGSLNGSGASLTAWRSTARSSFRQHLVAFNSPLDSRNVILESLRYVAARGDLASTQWFRMRNRLPGRVFGTTPSSTHLDVEYLALPRHVELPRHVGVCVSTGTDGARESRALLLSELGSSFVCVEDIDDAELENIDGLYKKVGLRRFRRIAVAWRNLDESPATVALAYRGPLGLNFSFLENRIELVVRTGLPPALREEAVQALLWAIQPVYDDAPLVELVVVARGQDRAALEAAGLRHVRSYRNLITSSAETETICEHVGGFFKAIERRQAARAAVA